MCENGITEELSSTVLGMKRVSRRSCMLRSRTHSRSVGGIPCSRCYRPQSQLPLGPSAGACVGALAESTHRGRESQTETELRESRGEISTSRLFKRLWLSVDIVFFVSIRKNCREMRRFTVIQSNQSIVHLNDVPFHITLKAAP